MNSPSTSHQFPGHFDYNRFNNFFSPQPKELFDDDNQVPTPEQFDAIISNYLNNLSPKKRDKALVDKKRYQLIQQVLREPRNTGISTAQFRFWVKKMFQLKPGSADLVCHDNKPVAMREQIYDILVKAHRDAHHGGRDKTAALVRRKFSWIPKELVARFVRHCPFCITRRSGGQSPGSMYTPKAATGVAAAAAAAASGNSSNIRYAFNGFEVSNLLHTPSTFQEDSSVSSGPPSAEYEVSPQQFVSGSPPTRQGLFEEEDQQQQQHQQTFYTYGSPSFINGGTLRTIDPSQSPILYSQQQQNYSQHYYYPNVLGIYNHLAAATEAVDGPSINMMGSVAETTSDILAHHQQQHNTLHPSCNITSYNQTTTNSYDPSSSTATYGQPTVPYDTSDDMPLQPDYETYGIPS